MIYIYLYAILAITSGCTISIVQANTEGEASDVVDAEQQASPNVAPNVTVPAFTSASRPKVTLIKPE